MDDRLESMYRRFTWRILSNYVSPWEFEQLREQITDYEQWCGAWCRQAEGHIRRGDEALAAGRRLTAGDAYVRAGLSYHWASFMFCHDQDQFRAALAAMAGAWEKAAPHLDPPMEILSVPYRDMTLNGYLRIPPGLARPPLVLLLPGADSTKEELYHLGDHIVARGLACAAECGGTAPAGHRGGRRGARQVPGHRAHRHHSVTETIELTQQAEAAGADFAVVINPLLSGCGRRRALRLACLPLPPCEHRHLAVRHPVRRPEPLAAPHRQAGRH
jgi:hypothetical protein